MRALVYILLMLTVACSTPPRDPDECRFRQAAWGDSPKDVKRYESVKLRWDSLNNTLVGYDTVLESPVMLTYQFRNQRLIEAYYSFKVELEENNRNIDDWNTLVEELTTKYGRPDYNDWEWFEGAYDSDWGRGIANGQLRLHAGWDTEVTYIYAHLQGSDGGMQLGILYRDADEGFPNPKL